MPSGTHNSGGAFNVPRQTMAGEDQRNSNTMKASPLTTGVGASPLKMTQFMHRPQCSVHSSDSFNNLATRSNTTSLIQKKIDQDKLMRNKVTKPVRHQFNSTRGMPANQSTDDLLFRNSYKNPFATSPKKTGVPPVDERQSLSNVNLTAEQVANLSVEQIIAMSKKESTKEAVPAYSDP